MQFICVQATGEAFRPQKRKKQTLQKMKDNNCFLSLWVIFALLDPDCESGSGYRSSDPIESGSGSTALHFIFENENKSL
jgi:hypothetical protein